MIARVMERVIRARWPRARYVAPFHGRLLLAVRAIVPTWVMDAMKRLSMGLRPSAMGPSSVEPVAA